MPNDRTTGASPTHRRSRGPWTGPRLTAAGQKHRSPRKRLGVLMWPPMEKPVEPFNLPAADVPTVDAYKKAFLACKPALRSIGGRSVIREMLSAHYRSPDHTITPGQLAAHPNIDLATHSLANTQYGKYAKALCLHFGLTPKFQLAILVSFSDGVPGEDTVKLTMLPHVVTALEDLGWVKPA